ncbi:hypothetical protein WN51_03867 [Melipona quadrifasciata]|uniref:Uncharacterized protein n=1 Tax=Melipona quadrifasciata TaxID=166423 RepID=A0A0M9AAX1_9HYME|nr:hypothetical protein WN51_03867 [Melipona quadrifasciata]
MEYYYLIFYWKIIIQAKDTSHRSQNPDPRSSNIQCIKKVLAPVKTNGSNPSKTMADLDTLIISIDLNCIDNNLSDKCSHVGFVYKIIIVEQTSDEGFARIQTSLKVRNLLKESFNSAFIHDTNIIQTVSKTKVRKVNWKGTRSILTKRRKKENQMLHVYFEISTSFCEQCSTILKRNSSITTLKFD